MLSNVLIFEVLHFYDIFQYDFVFINSPLRLTLLNVSFGVSPQFLSNIASLLHTHVDDLSELFQILSVFYVS